MLFGGTALLLVGTGFGEWQTVHWQAVLPESWLAWVYLVVFGSMVAFSAYGYLARRVPPGVAATYAYVNPIVAVLLGVFIASEPFTLRMGIAGLCLLGGVALITIGQANEKKVPEPEHL
jgi:drug/metabolite transporter (DMT)-like permease